MNFKALREKAELSVGESSKRLGIKTKTLYKYEAAIRHPSQQVLIKMVDIYMCSTDEVMEAYKFNVEKAVNKYGKINP